MSSSLENNYKKSNLNVSFTKKKTSEYFRRKKKLFQLKSENELQKNILYGSIVIQQITTRM